MKHSTELKPSRFERVYLSRAMSRAFDGPIGDPYGGSAYGKREMPVVAVIGAVAGGVALATGVATGFAAIAAIGAVVSGVGVLVGDSDLAKIGGIMGLAGGVGMLGTSQGWSGFADMNKAMGGMGGAAESVTNTGAMIDAPSVGVDAPSPAAGIGTSPDVGGGIIQQTAAEPGVLQSTLQGPSPTDVLPGGGAVTGQPIASVDQLAAQAAGPAVANPNPLISQAMGATSPGQGIMGYTSGQVPLTDSGSMWDKFEKLSGWMDQHKVASEAILKGIGGFSDSFSDKSEAEADYLKASAAARNEQIAASEAQRANANYAPNVANRFALTPGLTPFRTGTPTYIAPRTGLINATR